MKRTRLPLYALIAGSVFALGCTKTIKVERVDAQQEFAHTDRWNAMDSKQVADSMIGDMLSFPWVERFQRETGKTRPVVIVQNIYNKSAEQIPVETFVNDLRLAAIRSGRIDFVAHGGQRQDLREERSEQAANARTDTVKPFGEEIGADFALSGTINSLVDQLDDKRVTFYQTDLVLIDLKTNIQVWAGQNKIQKVQQKTLFGL
jgi:uncharacterized protein (TIGR02722 family)